jgi:hypothetical protein
MTKWPYQLRERGQDERNNCWSYKPVKEQENR